MSDLLLTKTGIPNTCCECGEMQDAEWYALHDDMALSGQGLCPPCAGIKPKAKAKRAKQPKAAPPEPKEELPLEEAVPEKPQA